MRAVQFLGFIEALRPLSVSAFDEKELAKASRPIKKFGDQALTLADAHGLAIMTERRVGTCWSTDRHLGLTGATLAI